MPQYLPNTMEVIVAFGMYGWQWHRDTSVYVTHERSRMNSEVQKVILCAQIKPNAAKLIGQCFPVQTDNDPRVSQGEECDIP